MKANAREGLAEFARSRRKRARKHLRRLPSGKVVTVGGSKKRGSSAARNLELVARSARSLTYSADTLHRMANRASRSGGSGKSLVSVAADASREGRGWIGSASKVSSEARRWASSDRARGTVRKGVRLGVSKARANGWRLRRMSQSLRRFL